MTAAVSAIAGTKDDRVTCDERSFAPDDATLRGGRAVGAGRIRVLGGTTPIVPGQALLLGSVVLLVYTALFLAVVFSFVRLYEEPTLRRRYGAEYDAYCAAVPGWWPRLRLGRDADA